MRWMVTAVAESKAPASSNMAEIIAIIPIVTLRSTCKEIERLEFLQLIIQVRAAVESLYCTLGYEESNYA